MAVKKAQSIRFEVDSVLTNTSLVAMSVRGLCAITTLSPVETNHLELCLVEVVNNAIEHAYGNQPGHTVEVVVELEKTLLTITVSDWGSSIPQSNLEDKIPAGVDSDSPETVLCSGRGLHIVRSLMDTVEYSSHQGRNDFSMAKNLRH